MKQEYRHLGYYNDVDDIIDLFPSEPLKGYEASLINSYVKDGYGNFYSTDDTGDILSADDNMIEQRNAKHTEGFGKPSRYKAVFL